LSLDDIPKDGIVQSEILMRDHVSQAGNFPPGDFRMLLPETARRLAGCLTNYLQASDYCQECTAILFQPFRTLHLVSEIQNILAGL
jgi:hypothetical protein